jgi:hypothetical protein
VNELSLEFVEILVKQALQSMQHYPAYLQANFETVTSREAFLEDSTYNQLTLSCLPSLLLDAMDAFKALELPGGQFHSGCGNGMHDAYKLAYGARRSYRRKQKKEHVCRHSLHRPFHHLTQHPIKPFTYPTKCSVHFGPLFVNVLNGLLVSEANLL